MRTNRLWCMVLVVLAAGWLRAQDIAGTWQGTMQMGKEQRIVVKIERDGAAGWQGVVYNLDSNQPGEGRRAAQMNVQGGDLRFALPSIDGSYQGKLDQDGATVTGTLTLGGTAHPLNLARVNGEAAWEIPKANRMMARDADPDWDVVTVRPKDPNDGNNNSSMGMKGSQFVMVNRSVEMLLQAGYGVHAKQIVGAPSWIQTERWNITGVPDTPGQPNVKQMQSLIRKVLAERFGLKLHKESREMSVYASTVAPGGDKMARSAGDPNGMLDENDNVSNGMGTMRITNCAMSEFAIIMSFFLDRPAVDQTGLAGRYDFSWKWTTDESRAPTDGSAPPEMFTAIQQQVGLKLVPMKAPADVLVIDALERPGAN